MENLERSQIEALSSQDQELRTLWEQHQDFEKRLEEFDRQAHLTPSEDLERRQIQKLKLAGKDRIAQILARHSG